MENTNTITVSDEEIKAEMKSMAKKKNALEKGLIYLGNYAARPIGNALRDGLDLGNPLGAIMYGVVDVINSKNTPLTRLINTAVKKPLGLIYATRTVGDLIGIAKGNYEHLSELPFNASMAYASFKDTLTLRGIADNIKEFKDDLAYVFDKN